jgi:hypothetical protein
MNTGFVLTMIRQLRRSNTGFVLTMIRQLRRSNQPHTGESYQARDDRRMAENAAVADFLESQIRARPLAEWHEDCGPVLWFTWRPNAREWEGEPAWIGSPTDSDWPGYHTHWIPHPQFPQPPKDEK